MKTMKTMGRQRGLTILEAMFALIVLSMMIPVIVMYMRDSTDHTQEKVAAYQMEKVLSATKDYVHANYSALLSSTSPGNPKQVTIATLKTGGYLSPNFSNQNVWRQNFKVYVTQPHPNDLLSVILTSGGESYVPGPPSQNGRFANKVVPASAGIVGADGGYVPTGVVPGETNSTIQGVYGGYKYTFAGTGVPNPGAGHMAAVTYFNNSNASNNDYLYRSKVPGQPKLNQMETDLDMNGNNITMENGGIGTGANKGVGEIHFNSKSASGFTCANNAADNGTLFYDNSGGLYLCKGGQKVAVADQQNTSFVVGSGYTPANKYVTKPTCPNGVTPHINVSPVWVSDNQFAYPIKAIQAVYSDNGSNWRVRERVMTTNPSQPGWVYLNSTYGLVQTVVTCGK